jgi:hypothetical protein
MASAYPAALDAFATNHVDDVGEVIEAADINDLADAANKIEAELGTDPSGTFADVAARLQARQTVRKTADQTFTTQTLANVTDMVFALLANVDYAFKFWVPYTAGAARGIGIGVTLPASATIFGGGTIYGQANTDGTAAAWHGTLTSSGDAVVNTPTAGATSSFAMIQGIVSVAGTAGNMQLQARQGAGATGVNAVVKKGAFGWLYVA